MKRILLRVSGILLYILGVVTAGGFGLVTVWAGFEASLFDTSLSAEERLATLRCPLFLTEFLTETGTSMISAVFTNSIWLL